MGGDKRIQPPLKAFMVWTATIIIIIIIIIIIVFAFTQCIYNYIPETNYISSVYSVAAVLYLQLCYM